MCMPSLSVDEAVTILKTAIELVINYFNNATCYTKKEAERRFGDAFKQSGIKREEVKTNKV